jgi:glycosyltransferase involved in cell wall biosynthesis
MLSIVIPVKGNDDADVTLWSLQDSSFSEFVVILVPDQGNGANWARNKGFTMVNTEFVLFSDNDIRWKARGIEWLMQALKENPDASYAYGAWQDQRGILCEEEFDPELLKKRNYISTMSLIRTKDFCMFDEDIERLQDWDLFLNLWINYGRYGVNCGKIIFNTITGGGITDESSESYQKAKEIIIKKHNL